MSTYYASSFVDTTIPDDADWRRGGIPKAGFLGPKPFAVCTRCVLGVPLLRKTCLYICFNRALPQNEVLLSRNKHLKPAYAGAPDKTRQRPPQLRAIERMRTDHMSIPRPAMSSPNLNETSVAVPS